MRKLGRVVGWVWVVFSVFGLIQAFRFSGEEGIIVASAWIAFVLAAVTAWVLLALTTRELDR